MRSPAHQRPRPCGSCASGWVRALWLRQLRGLGAIGVQTGLLHPKQEVSCLLELEGRVWV